MRKRILWICDWMLDRTGQPMTGYGNISDVYCRELAKEYNVIALGFAYARNQHNYPFSLSQVKISALNSAVQSINESYPLDFIVSSVDIPLEIQILAIPRKKAKFIGIFAVESSPLYAPWAMGLANMDYPFAISDFGAKECQKVGVNAKHLVVPINRETWRPRTLEERDAIKDTLGLTGKTVLFVNGAGNERKNLSTVLESVRDMKDKNIYLFMLTNIKSQVSWDLPELLNRFQINKNVTLIDKGVSQSEIWKMYAGSDFFINISKGEGMCAPILEAMSVGLPVIATNCTAMKDHVSDGRGIPIDPDFQTIDVFGNTDRYYVLHDSLTKTLETNIQILKDSPEYFVNMAQKAQQYIEDRNNVNSIDELRKVINVS